MTLQQAHPLASRSTRDPSGLAVWQGVQGAVNRSPRRNTAPLPRSLDATKGEPSCKKRFLSQSKHGARAAAL